VGKHFESEYGLLQYLKQTDKIVRGISFFTYILIKWCMGVSE